MSEETVTTQYGSLYWCVKLPNRSEVRLMADEALILPSGALSMVQHHATGTRINLAFAPGQWVAVYAASLIDGGAVAVEHWDM